MKANNKLVSKTTKVSKQQTRNVFGLQTDESMQTRVKILKPNETVQFRKYNWDLIEPNTWYTARELAEILGCKVRYIYSRLNRAWKTQQKVNGYTVVKGITADGRIVFMLQE